MTLAVPNQRTWAVGDIVTAAMMNANVRDAVNFLTNPPICVAYQNVAQSVPTATSTQVNFDGSLVDPYGGHSTSVSTWKYTPVVPGWYLANFDLQYSSNSTGVREAIVLLNGATTTPANYRQILPALGATELQVSGIVYCNGSTDYISVSAYQNSGVTLTLNNASMNILWLHS